MVLFCGAAPSKRAQHVSFQGRAPSARQHLSTYHTMPLWRVAHGFAEGVGYTAPSVFRRPFFVSHAPRSSLTMTVKLALSARNRLHISTLAPHCPSHRACS